MTTVKGARKLPETVGTTTIEADLKSPSTTTEQTLSCLRAILGIDLPVSKSEVSQNVKRPIQKPHVPPQRPAAPKPTARRKPADFPIHETPDHKPAAFGTKERRKLATETFNTTLKSLTGAAKTKREPKQPTSPQPCPKSQRETVPLKDCSPNRKLKPERQTQKPVDDWNATAGCASAALDCLRQLKSQENPTASVDLGLENGGLILLDKLITLELKEEASAQARTLHDQYWKTRKSKAGDVAQGPIPERQSTYLCLDHEAQKDGSKFAIGFQSQLLRLAILQSPSSLSDEFIKAMTIDTRGSPSWSILDAHTSKHIDAEACGSQLRTVSLVLTNLASTAAEERTSTQEQKLLALTLASIALQIKCLSWKYLNHSPDLQKEFWSPFARHVQRTMKSVKDVALVRGLTSSCVKMMVDRLSGMERAVDIPKCLSMLFEMPSPQGHNKVTTLTTSMEKLKVSETPSDLMTCLRTAASHLESFSNAPENALTMLDQSMMELTASARLTSTDLDNALLAGANLRKHAVVSCTTIERVLASDAGNKFPRALQISCLRYVCTFVGFVRRYASHYLDPKPSKQAQPKKTESFILTLAKSIEALLVCEKHPLTQSTVLDEDFLKAYSTCGELIKLVDSMPIKPPESMATFLSQVPLQLSHLLWVRFLHQTEKRDDTSKRSHTLQDSINIILNSPLAEKQKSLLGLKFEKMASLCVERGHFSKAQENLKLAICFTFEQGVLTDAVEQSLSSSPNLAWSNPSSPIYSMLQPLALYIKNALIQATTAFLYDDDELPPINRAVLLEQQILYVIREMPQLLKKELLVPYIRQVIELCSQPCYDFCKLRFVGRVIYLIERTKCLNATDFFVEDAIRQMTSIKKQNCRDVYLAEMGTLLSLTVSLQWAFASGEMDEEVLCSMTTSFKHKLKNLAGTSNVFSNILDLEVCTGQLTALADLAGAFGMIEIQADALQAFMLLTQDHSAYNVKKRIVRLIQSGLVLDELNQTSEAGKILASAEGLLKGDGEYAALHSVASASYYLSISNTVKCAVLLQSAMKTFGALSSDRVSSSARFDAETLLCRAALVASKLASSTGQLDRAAQFARQAVKLSNGAWLMIDKAMPTDTSANDQTQDITVQSISQDISKLNLQEAPLRLANTHGAKYWTQISLHRTALRHMANVSVHQGLHQDAMFFTQDALKVAKRTAGKSLTRLISSELGLIQAYAGQSKPSSAVLSSLSATSVDHSSITELLALFNLAEGCLCLNDVQNAQQLLVTIRASTLLTAMTDIQEANPKPLPNIASTRRGKTPRKAIAAPPLSSPKKSKPQQPLGIQDMVARKIVLEHNVLLSDRINSVNIEIPELQSPGPRLLASLSRASLLVNQALKQLAKDPASNAIAETALALPVKHRARKSGQMSLLLDNSNSPLAKKKTAKVNANPTSAGSSLLQEAYNLISMVEEEQMASLSTAQVEMLSKTLSQINLLSTALSQLLTYSPMSVVLQSLLPKDIARARDRHSILAENFTSTKEQLHMWPELFGVAQPSETFRESFESLINILPSPWFVVSIGLSQDRKELLLSKIVADSTPFLMRIPLGRPGLDEDEPSEFTFEHAKSELQDIVKLANETAQDARGSGSREERKAWFAEREKLDKRLKYLLLNIENIWLGGFRGLLSAPQDISRVASFGKSMSQILGQHLPSRQKTGAIAKSKVDLHSNVLQLFTGIPFSDETSFEEAITDLLYFVIDVLQFNGEPNAYDEIDFDAMLVDVLDALRGYHAEDLASETQHTILILDKEIQAFPWESLPCLQNKAVSRMPSLGAIKERLDRIRLQDSTAAHYTLARQGSYILNPSGDLTSTEMSLGQVLKAQLSNFSAISNRAPTETEFKSCLEESALMLYFGHGSGAQYIRGRTIRKLKKVAVTWLMGCSSSNMKEVGSFESYGMMGYYMNGLAGMSGLNKDEMPCMGVVGCLWDVTDRDLDRCAGVMMGGWGLVEMDEDDDLREKGKGKKKVKKIDVDVTKHVVEKEKRERWEARKGKMSLDEVMSWGRDKCVLRYLNGAAVVYYGVPVVLEERL